MDLNANTLPAAAATGNSTRARRPFDWPLIRRLAGYLPHNLAGYLPHNNVIPRLQYRRRFAKQRNAGVVGHRGGFSIVMATRNRREFLSCAVDALLSNTHVPFELIIMDNASDDRSSDLCRYLEATNPGVVRHVRLRRNIGTNAYALGFLEAQYQYLVDMDDDILAVSKGWDRATIDAFDAFPRLGFLAMNVVQDRYTDGAKRGRSEYAEVMKAQTTLEIGPTGGWFSVTTRAIYNEVGGFVFRPHKPFPAEDGRYVRELSKRGYFAGILKNKYVYHASGPYWNCAYGYREIWDEKYGRDHKERLPWIRNVQVGSVPSFQYAETMVIGAE